jgi:hypothetical protein
MTGNHKIIYILKVLNEPFVIIVFIIDALDLAHEKYNYYYYYYLD